jgi:hypothetical protein
MTTTTIKDGNLGASHIGAYVQPEDGSARDQLRQIKSRSTTTGTVDAAWTSTASVTSVRVWTPGDVPVRATGSGSTTTVVSSPHASITNEPDSYWLAKGYHLIAAGGQNAGKASKVTAFATSGGTFTIADAVTSTVADELWLLRKRLRPEGQVTFDLNRKEIARTIVGYGDAAPSVMVNYDGSVGFNLPVRGLTASAGNATAAVAPVEMSDLLAAIFTQTLDTGDLSAPSSSGNVINVTTGGSRWSVGGFMLAPTGEVGQVRSIASTAITVGPSHITAASVEEEAAVYASSWYQRKATDFRTFCFDYFMGGLFRKVAHGCMPTLTVSITRDQMVSFAFKYMVAEGHEYTLSTWVTPAATLPIANLDTTVPFDAKGSRCLFNGVNVLMDNLTIDFGFVPVLRNSLTGSNQSDGCMMTLKPQGGTFTIKSDEDDRSSFEDVVDLMNRRASLDFLYQKGSAPGNTWAVAVPALQVVSAPQKYTAGQGEYAAKWAAIRPQDIPGNSFNAALPALSMGWL